MILKASMSGDTTKQTSYFMGNPENPQHQQAFVSLYDDEKGVTVSNKGLNEYEIPLETTPLQ